MKDSARALHIYDVIYSASERATVESSQDRARDEQETYLRSLEKTNRAHSASIAAKKVELVKQKTSISLRELQKEVEKRLDERGLPKLKSESQDYLAKKLNDPSGRGFMGGNEVRILDEICNEILKKKPTTDWVDLLFSSPIEKLNLACPNSNEPELPDVADDHEMSILNPDADINNDFEKMLTALRVAVSHAKNLQAGILNGKKTASFNWGYVQARTHELDEMERFGHREFLHVVENVNVRDGIAWLLEKELDLPCRHRQLRKVGQEGEIDKIDAISGTSERPRLAMADNEKKLFEAARSNSLAARAAKKIYRK